jgi:cyanophycin synthetase
MKFQELRPLPGPNIYTHRSALVALLDLEDLAGRESHEFKGFVDRLLQTLPTLAEHHCGLGYPGGFVERLREGTYFGHVVEHVALELQSLAGFDVRHGKTRETRDPRVYRLVIEYTNEAAGRYCLEAARHLVEACLEGQNYQVDECLQEARLLAERTELGPSTRAIADAALKRNIPVMRLDEGSLIQLGYGQYRRLVAATETQFTSSVSVDIAGDKAATKALLAKTDIPTPRGQVVRSVEQAVAQLEALHPPLAVKPLDGNQGRGVSLDVVTAEELARAFQLAAEVSSRVIVEELFAGRDYRVLVVNGKMVAASERVPAHVVGDGKFTISELIDLENQNPQRGDGHSRPLTKLPKNEDTVDYLRQHGRSLEDVPGAGERVLLRATANLSTGGTARDVTDEVHPATRRMCERAARVIGLDVCGIDLVTPDITQPPPDHGAGIIEVNAAPGIRMHHFPSSGTPRDAAGAIVDMLYPPGFPSRIPSIAITGTNGKTTVSRMIADAVNASGKTAGLTTTDGIYIGGHCVTRGDMTGYQSCRMVLTDPGVQVAVLETARGGIVRRSLGYDWTDVGIITNVQPDHLGQDGIETVEDLLHVKGLIAERVRDGGTLILNADDPNLVRLRDRPLVRAEHKKVVFFSLQPENPVVRQHLKEGGRAYYSSDGWLVEAGPGGTEKIVRENAIPTTFGGAARFQVANALAALAGARALGVPLESITGSLTAFDGGGHNPGRMNLFRVGEGFALLDYGHNPAAFEAIGGLARQWSNRRVTSVFTVPGDRTDELIVDSGRVVARNFDRVIVREDEDTRGRKVGEVANLLCQAVHDVKPHVDCQTELDECEAVRMALRQTEPNEIVLIFHDNYDAVMGVLREFGAQETTPEALTARQEATARPAPHDSRAAVGRPRPEYQSTVWPR